MPPRFSERRVNPFVLLLAVAVRLPDDAEDDAVIVIHKIVIGSPPVKCARSSASRISRPLPRGRAWSAAIAFTSRTGPGRAHIARGARQALAGGKKPRITRQLRVCCHPEEPQAVLRETKEDPRIFRSRAQQLAHFLSRTLRFRPNYRANCEFAQKNRLNCLTFCHSRLCFHTHPRRFLHF